MIGREATGTDATGEIVTGETFVGKEKICISTQGIVTETETRGKRRLKRRSGVGAEAGETLVKCSNNLSCRSRSRKKSKKEKKSDKEREEESR